jgi:DNA-binding protein HU-beta
MTHRASASGRANPNPPPFQLPFLRRRERFSRFSCVFWPPPSPIPCVSGDSDSTLRIATRRRFEAAASSRQIAGLAARQEKEKTMNKLELVEHVATETECSKAAAAAAIDAVIDGITKALKKGEEVRLVGFGTFSVKKRAAGKGRNPATGEEIKIPASKNARFKPGATLKTALNKTK